MYRDSELHYVDCKVTVTKKATIKDENNPNKNRQSSEVMIIPMPNIKVSVKDFKKAIYKHCGEM